MKLRVRARFDDPPAPGADLASDARGAVADLAFYGPRTARPFLRLVMIVTKVGSWSSYFLIWSVVCP